MSERLGGMRMITNYLTYRKLIRHTVETFEAHQSFLLSGKYRMTVGHESFVFRNDPETIANLNKMFSISLDESVDLLNYREFTKKILLPKRLEVFENDKKMEFQGTVIYLTSRRRSAKIFNFNKLEVLSVYDDISTLKKYLENYFYYSKYFCIPEIKSYNLNEKTCLEELILHKLRNSWSTNDEQRVMNQLFNMYKRYYRTIIQERKISKTTIHPMVKAIRNDPYLSKLGELLECGLPEKLITMEIPCVNQHGDLWSSNILISYDDEEKYYLIDWEHSGEYVFFFDFFKWIELETFKNKNDNYLNRYLSGGYDREFDELFSILGIQYDEKHKVAYFFMYFADYFYKRVLDKSIHRKMQIHHKYSQFFAELLESVPAE
jgi:thiamine kinase-like enzyme